MLRRLLLLWPLLVLMVVYAGSVLLFCTSMLSTSTVMRTVATEPCSGTRATPVDQVVVVLIDAMRPDFVLSQLRPFARTGGRCNADEDHSLAAIWADNRYTGPTLHYMEEALRSHGDAAVAHFLVADAPTTTAQRIKAIATGTMPAFLEAGANFNSEATELDSIVAQMNGSAVLLGDDTWEKLFPNTAARRHWKRAVGIPSFDVADFHTNDDAVLAEVYDVLRSETAEKAAAAAGEETPDSHAKLVVAHFLGIDHVGHRIDSDNPFMRGKILQLDEMLRNVSEVLRERPTAMSTMLLVMGDHGMTNSGDHGGGSAQETDTFLFAQYFPGALQAPRTARHEEQHQRHESPANHTAAAASSWDNLAAARRLVQQRWRDRVDAEFDRLRSCRDASGVPADRLGAAYQVDVTATIAVLLGRPIPYSSFGRVMPEVLALANASIDVAAAERCNLEQLQRYFSESKMKIPRDASWAQPASTASVTQQLADMSYYARRTRTDMHRPGMFVGSTGLLLCAMSLLWSPTIRSYLSRRRSGWMMRWTTLVVVLRLCTVFSNSFVVNEDSELLGLLCSLLLSLCVTQAWTACKGSVTSAPTGRRKVHLLSSMKRLFQVVLRTPRFVFFAVLLLVLRLSVPQLLRYRAHITHTVETDSAVDRFVLAHPILQMERAGVVAAGVLWVVLYPRVVPPMVVAATCVAVAAVYHVPVAHHALPLLCAVAAPLLRIMGRSRKDPSHPSSARPSAWWWCTAASSATSCCAYRYLLLVLWLASLCNGKVATAVVVALYGVALPRLCDALRVAPIFTQAVVLHLAAFVVFFAEGHQCMLNTIDWNASFVGMPFYNMYLGGVLVLSRTFHAFLLVPVALHAAPHVCQVGPKGVSHDAEALLKRDDDAAPQTEKAGRIADSQRDAALDSASPAVVVTALYFYLLVVQSAVSCFNGYIQKTHLMLFPIFCPKLIFDAVIALLTSVVVVVTVAVF